MARQRYESYKEIVASEERRVDPETGRPICRQCGVKPCLGRRSVYCSRKCQQAFSMRFSGQAIRTMAFERDEGVCAMCRTDCRSLEAIRDKALRKKGMLTRYEVTMYGETWRSYVAQLDIPGHLQISNTTLWYADHIMPVESGGKNTPENIQTLCFRCHNEKTRDEAGQRARRPKKKHHP